MRSRRQSPRRAVALECTLLSELWDGELSLPASNLSDGGIWIETAVAPDPGEELVVAFSPPGAQQVWTAARVVWVGAFHDHEPSAARRYGMGLEFTASTERHVRLLAQALRGTFRPMHKAASIESPASLESPSGVEQPPASSAGVPAL